VWRCRNRTRRSRKKLLESDQLVRIYLDELPPAPPDQFEMGVLELVAAVPETALKKGQETLPRPRVSKRPKPFQRTPSDPIPDGLQPSVFSSGNPCSSGDF
jgi:hypothetical protein